MLKNILFFASNICCGRGKLLIRRNVLNIINIAKLEEFYNDSMIQDDMTAEEEEKLIIWAVRINNIVI